MVDNMIQRHSMITTNNMELEGILQLDTHHRRMVSREKEQNPYEYGKEHVERKKISQ